MRKGRGGLLLSISLSLPGHLVPGLLELQFSGLVLWQLALGVERNILIFKSSSFSSCHLQSSFFNVIFRILYFNAFV